LAERFGVSRANIEAIVYRRSWRHLAPEVEDSGVLVTSSCRSRIDPATRELPALKVMVRARCRGTGITDP